MGTHDEETEEFFAGTKVLLVLLVLVVLLVALLVVMLVYF